MNQFHGVIHRITTSGSLSIVDIECGGILFSSVVVETPAEAPYLREENPLAILFKESEVSLAKNFSGELSIRNQIPSRMKGVEKGEVLSRVFLESAAGLYTAIITTRSFASLNLRTNDAVTGLVKATEVILMEQRVEEPASKTPPRAMGR